MPLGKLIKLASENEMGEKFSIKEYLETKNIIQKKLNFVVIVNPMLKSQPTRLKIYRKFLKALNENIMHSSNCSLKKSSKNIIMIVRIKDVIAKIFFLHFYN